METDSSDNDEFTKPIFTNGCYGNPWDTWEDPSLFKVFKMIFVTKDFSSIPGSRELDDTLPVAKPDFHKLENPPKDKIQSMWIGHASVLVQFDGITVITDPIFSDRCSPIQMLGPKRYRPPPCKIAELSKTQIDAIVISHNHYDHLDYKSVLTFNQTHGDKIWWYVPMGTRQWMLNCGCKNVIELTWWEEKPHPEKPEITFALTPSQHWCKRSMSDTNKCLWGSWVVKGPKHSFFFAGDTGYCKGFKQIGKKYGPISYAAIPIGAYYPRWFMKPQHVDPEEAVMIHEEVKAIKSVGIHWGTFRMTREHYLEPREKLKEELAKKSLDPSAFITVPHGEVQEI